MEIADLSAFKIFKGQRLYDDEQPLNKNTPDFDFRRPIDDPAPYVVVVQGPRNVGKSLLIESLRTNNLMKGMSYLERTDRTVATTFPVVTASGKVIRLQFVECPDDINGMIDAAKYADVVISMVDASYGFEMETFEFRNLLQVHGFPKVIGVLTHLDCLRIDKASKLIPCLVDRFRTEICEGAKVFSLGIHRNGFYDMSDIDGLAKVLSDSQFLPSSWRAQHPYVLVDHCEDVTSEREHGDKQFNRNLSLYGYLRGCDIKKGARVHIAGAGDFSLAGVTRSDAYDPCPVRQSHFEDCKTGNYVRLDVLDLPPEIVEKFDHHYPILVGGILPEEENSGYMQVKLRRHSWRTDLLMTGAPITVSAGWRHYQTTAVYAMENENEQHQLLNYTPEHQDCLAVFWGPLAPPKTKIVAVQDTFCLKNKEAFRIVAKGVVLDFNREAQILLKVENIGIAVLPDGKTAHIKFAPELKIDKLIGVPIQTKSGNRGKIYEAAGEGTLKCTFEDPIHMSDPVLFPVLATLVLPSLFKQLNLLFKPLEIAVDGSFKATIAATIAAINAAVAATIVTVGATSTVEDELAVSYEKVAPRRQMPDLRRAVVIHEGERQYLSSPNPLESFYSSVVQELKAIEKSKCCVAGEISGEINGSEPMVIDDEVNGSEPMVIDDDSVRSEGRAQYYSEPVVFDNDIRPGESAVQSFLRRYGTSVPTC